MTTTEIACQALQELARYDWKKAMKLSDLYFDSLKKETDEKYELIQKYLHKK